MRVGVDQAHVGVVDQPAANPERPCLGEELVGEDVEVERLDLRRKSGRSERASRSRSSTRRLIRSSSSLITAVASRRSSGSSPSVSRWPRITVIGVRSSCPTSARNSFCDGERRLQAVEHAVEGPAELGDLALAAHVHAVREVGLGDRPRGPGQGAQRLHRPPRRQPDEERGQQRDHDRDAGGDPHRALHAVAIVVEQLGRDEHAGLPPPPLTGTATNRTWPAGSVSSPLCRLVDGRERSRRLRRGCPPGRCANGSPSTKAVSEPSSSGRSRFR